MTQEQMTEIEDAVTYGFECKQATYYNITKYINKSKRFLDINERREAIKIATEKYNEKRREQK